MAKLSGGVRISDLNDFIAPSSACVVALNGKKLEIKEVSRDHLASEPVFVRLPW